MFNKTLISALALVATTGAAVAMDTTSQGAAMLAKTLGVEPGVYELSDLVRIDGIGDETDEYNTVTYILGEGRGGYAGRADTTGSSVVSSDQLARAYGVETGVYSVNELVRIDAADEDNEARFVGTGADRADTANSRSDSPARQQLAAGLNVDAADFTLSQLIELQRAVSENDSFRVRTILADAGVDVPAGVVLR